MGVLSCSLITLFLLVAAKDVSSATFTFTNRCDYTVWPGILANIGSPKLDTTGFELPQETTRTFIAPTGWSGRFWGRTSCTLTGSGLFSCLTADCGSGQVECNGLGANPPATLAEFTLGSGTQDFYDVSLVDGYNLPMVVEGTGGSGECGSTGCVTDLNRQCPAELRVGDGDACKSACEAFGSAEYCCSGAFSTPDTCRPSVYSEMFKSACPRSYSYAYDDATSTFTCTGADYAITFCPSSPSQKSSRDVTPAPTLGTPTDPSVSGSGSVSTAGSTTDFGSGSTTGSGATETGSSYGYESMGSGSGSGSEATIVADGSWLAGLAMGDSSTTSSPRTILQSALISFTTFSIILSFLYL